MGTGTGGPGERGVRRVLEVGRRGQIIRRHTAVESGRVGGDGGRDLCDSGCLQGLPAIIFTGSAPRAIGGNGTNIINGAARETGDLLCHGNDSRSTADVLCRCAHGSSESWIGGILEDDRGGVSRRIDIRVHRYRTAAQCCGIGVRIIEPGFEAPRQAHVINVKSIHRPGDLEGEGRGVARGNLRPHIKGADGIARQIHRCQHTPRGIGSGIHLHRRRDIVAIRIVETDTSETAGHIEGERSRR